LTPATAPLTACIGLKASFSISSRTRAILIAAFIIRKSDETFFFFSTPFVAIS
jgi:hypothetical protein